MEEEAPYTKEIDFINAVGQKWSKVDCNNLQGLERDKCTSIREITVQYGYDVLSLQKKASNCQLILEKELEQKSNLMKYEECMRDTESSFTLLVEKYYPLFKRADSR